ncbi:unnamed protein product [Rotaria socialis]|uniref:MULE transposase domain-containing protein n=1 Tax=Rotaria socialis TaxID=392032 RepID=A0A817WK87_9BILA|nr:unnamed protein product [Rotaria socialis]
MASAISFLTTNKGEPLLVFNQYMLKCNKTSLSKKYWVCTEHRYDVYVHTNLENEFLLITGDHNHVINPNTLEIKAIEDKMKNRILNETTSIMKIYDEEIAKVHLSDEGAAELPTVIEYRVPVAYCLLSNRRATTYIELFQRFKQEATLLGKQFQPTHVVSDFESAIMSAVRHVFPAAKHSGCLFHFTRNDTPTCKELMGLSLMPICEVEQQFKRIREILSSSLYDLLVYFERQWIKGSVPLSMWNSNDVDHRTNSISEGNEIKCLRIKLKFFLNSCMLILAYNRRFSTRISKKHPNVWTFIKLIQSENVRLEHIIAQLSGGASSSKKSKNTTGFQKRFGTLKKRFNDNEINTKQLLKGLALLLGSHKKRK